MMNNDENNNIPEDLPPPPEGATPGNIPPPDVPPPPAPPTASEAGEASFSPEEIEAGKTFAILTYALSFVGLPFFLVPLIMRDNDFSLYHAKQFLMLVILGITGGIIGSLTSVICIGFIILPVVSIFCLVCVVIGLIDTINGRAKTTTVGRQVWRIGSKGLQKK